MRTTAPVLALALVSSTLTPACYVRGGGGLFAAMAATAIVTAVVVSHVAPPPPRVVVVPEPRAGYVWQPGYWTLQDNQWVWVDGSWIEVREGYQWSPAHWESQPDGTWKLYPGHWVAVAVPE
jgi:hypothetical protein